MIFDLEDKPPPLVPSGTPADHAAMRDPLDENPSVKTERFLSKTIHAKPKKPDSKTARVRMKAPRSDHNVQVKKSEIVASKKRSWLITDRKLIVKLGRTETVFLPEGPEDVAIK